MSDTNLFGREKTDWLPLKENPEESINNAIDQEKTAFAQESEAMASYAQHLENQKTKKWAQLATITKSGFELKKNLDEKADIESQWDQYNVDLDEKQAAAEVQSRKDEKAKIVSSTDEWGRDYDDPNFGQPPELDLIPAEVIKKGDKAIEEWKQLQLESNKIDTQIYGARNNPNVPTIDRYQVLKTPTQKELNSTNTARANFEGDQFQGFVSRNRTRPIKFADLDRAWTYQQAMEAGEWDIARRLERHLVTAYVQGRKLNGLNTDDKKVLLSKFNAHFKIERAAFIEQEIKNDMKVTKANEAVSLVNDINNLGAAAVFEGPGNKGGGYLELHSIDEFGNRNINRAGIRLLDNLKTAKDLGLVDSTDLAVLLDDQTKFPAKDGSGLKTFEQLNPALFNSISALHSKWQISEANEIEKELEANAIVLTKEKQKEFEKRIEEGGVVSDDDIQQAVAEVANELGISWDHKYLDNLRATVTSFTGDDNELARFIQRDMDRGHFFEDPLARVNAFNDPKKKREWLKKIKDHNKTVPGIEKLKEFKEAIQTNTAAISKVQPGLFGRKNNVHLRIEDNAERSYLQKMRAYTNPALSNTLSIEEAHDKAVKEVNAEIEDGMHTAEVLPAYDSEDRRNIKEQMELNKEEIKTGANPLLQETPWLGESSLVIKQASDYINNVYGTPLPKYYIELAEMFPHLTPHELMNIRLKSLNVTDGKYTPPPEVGLVGENNNKLLNKKSSPSRTHRVLVTDAAKLLKVIEQGHPGNTFDTLKLRGGDVTALLKKPLSTMTIQELTTMLGSLPEVDMGNYTLGMYDIPARSLVELIVLARQSGVITNDRVFDAELQGELILFKNKLAAVEACKLNGLDCIPPDLIHLSKEEKDLFTAVMGEAGSTYNYFEELIPPAAQFLLTLPEDRRALQMEHQS